MGIGKRNNSELGVATVEFALTAAFFFMMLLAVIAGGYLFWVHNALVEATRRGSRYAANQCKPDLGGCPNSDTTIARVKNVTIYGNAEGTGNALVHGLAPENVEFDENSFSADFGVASGTVSVKIINYDFNFILSTVPIPMPPYQSTVVGENAGFLPGTCPE